MAASQLTLQDAAETTTAPQGESTWNIRLADRSEIHLAAHLEEVGLALSREAWPAVGQVKVVAVPKEGWRRFGGGGSIQVRPLEKVLPISKSIFGRQLDEELVEGSDQRTKLVAPETVLACWNEHDAVMRRIGLEVIGVQRAQVLVVVGYYRPPIARR